MSVQYVLRQLSIVALMALLLGMTQAVVPQEAKGQRWVQTARLLSEIRQDGPARALLDTLMNMSDRDTIRVKREPESSSTVTMTELRERLIDEAGIGLQSASHVFIDYRFEIANNGFQQSILDLFFVFRPGEDQEDIPILYLNGQDPWVQEILRNKGTTLVTNEAALRPFGEQLAFARMVQNGQIVEIANQTVREGFAAKKRQLVSKIQRLTYESQ